VFFKKISDIISCPNSNKVYYSREKSNKNGFNPIMPALRPPPTLFMERAIPRKVASLKSISLEFSLSAFSGFFKIL